MQEGRRKPRAEPDQDGRSPATARKQDPGAAIAAVVVAATLLCAGLIVDSRAESSFEAPKRLLVLAGAALATLAAFGFSRWRNPFAGQAGSPRSGRLANAAFLLLLAALSGALFSALASPRRALASDTMRVVLLTALFLPIGASRVLEGKRQFLLAAFLGVAATDACVSILQALGLYRPFDLVTQGSRESTGAFVGNPAYLALALSLASVAALGLLLTSHRPLVRVGAAAVLLLFIGALLVIQNLSSLSALAIGV
ncbi:MAG TPA: hypothetical protein VLO07_08600, partial [Thermoanaerobaculia bacterium]|nr:hypothetical protein [Thermoanaerobaculia bacterium]